MIKIIFSDMDGTLLTGDNKLPAGFHEMIAELKRRGVIFSPSSGRQYFSLLKTFPQYENEFIFIADSGTLVFRHSKEWFSSPMDKNLARQVLDEGAKLDNILCVYCGKNSAYIRDFQDVPEFTDELYKYYPRTITVKSWDDVDDVQIKTAFFDITANAKTKIFDKFLKFSDKLQVVHSSTQWVDVFMPEVNKGTAIKKIQQMLDIKPEECAAFGDYLNDVEMLQAVEYSFAMSNAHPDLKKFAKFETVSNDEGGVLVGIKKLIDMGLI